MKKIFFLIAFIITNCAYSQLVTEYWDTEQTKKKSEQQIKNGMQDGKFTAWYETGEIAKEGAFTEGKENGKFVTYYLAKNLNQKKIIFLAKNMVPGNIGTAMEIKLRKPFSKMINLIVSGPDGMKTEN
jgi:hypothetical protein